ncbi:MAG: DUF2326 domain-containing protein [Polyangiaceae bacterium]|nr:DUF2326 domain-containing protein [Polyangiaceae bacterium]
MIRRIYCDDSRFKNLSFKPGFNVVLAEKSPGATDKQTRNRAGKSSILEILHFLLGSNCDKDSVFRSDPLRAATFGLEFDLDGGITRVERSGARPGSLKVEGDSTRWPVSPKVKDNKHLIRNNGWKIVLAKTMFGLDDHDEPSSPTFRSLLSYFVRRDREGGMSEPMAQSRMQQLVDQQVNISFLLGLDWLVPHQWQQVRDREKSLEQLKKGMKEGAFGAVLESAALLKSELIVAQDRVRKLRTAVASFKVVEQYHELEREASTLTRRLADLADENLLDRRYLTELQQAIAEEIPPAPDDLECLYREAGVLLPDLVKKRFEEAALFHESVVRNRRAYLKAEVEAAGQRISGRDSEKGRLDARRSEVMTILKSAGALEHFTALQGELTRAEAHAEALRQKLDAVDALETGNLKLKVERAQLVERLRLDYVEQDATIEKAVLTFADIASRLYGRDKAGSLTITPTDNGPRFEAHMPGEKSKGVNNMRIFCFDMMLMLLSLERGRSPGFLVHDSHLFDGVDERQVGQALAVGAELAEVHGFQYIVTMNTDAVPKEVPAGFRVEDHALDVRLTDASEDGGLFGFRFD